MDDILKGQLDYYRARAGEYDESLQQTGRFAANNASEASTPASEKDWAEIVAALHRLTPGKETLELACGTGIWTKELLAVSESITATDGAPEMLDVNQAKLNDSRVQYALVDLFTWQPTRSYDLVFFAFWLSHVPPERLGDFLDKVAQATRIGGQVFIVDEPLDGKQISGPNEQDLYQTRELYDGRAFQIVKVYHDPRLIQKELEARGFTECERVGGDSFFGLCGTHTDEIS